MIKIPVINGLRGIAICGIIFHHSFFKYFLYGQRAPDFLTCLMQSFLSSGWLGVNLFFILSGLVLYWPYACKKRSCSGGADIRQFYTRRFWRLFPLYWFICLVSLVFAVSIPLADPAFLRWFVALATVTFPFLASSFVPQPNWVLWSLGAEILFSLLFPLIVILVQKVGWRRLLWAVFALSFVTRIVGQMLFYAAPSGYLLNVISDSVFGRLDEFVLGMLLAHLIANPGQRPIFSRRLVALGAIAIACTMYAWGAWLRLEMPAWSAALIALPFDLGMFVTIGYLATAERTSRMRWFFERRPLQMLGLMCYSIYLWHGIVLLRLPDYDAGVLQYLAYLLIVLLLSGFTYRYIEFGREQNLHNLLPAKRA